LPEEILEGAMQVTQKGITETLIQGLKLVQRSGAWQQAKALRGQLDLQINIEESRERRGR
jgi:hypothetical protein